MKAKWYFDASSVTFYIKSIFVSIVEWYFNLHVYAKYNNRGFHFTLNLEKNKALFRTISQSQFEIGEK